MKVVNLHAAKTHLSRLVDAVEKGAEITIAKAGRPVARLVAMPAAKPRVPGLLAGSIEITEDFDAPLPAGLLALFEGDSKGKGTARKSPSKKPKSRK